MSQNDFDVANQAGAPLRADINSALQALATLSSGANAPSTSYARMQWADTTSNQLKRRNAANSGWIVVGSLDETFVLSRSSNTILAEADRDKTLIATASFTQTLTTAATLGNGWKIDVIVDAGAVLVVDPFGSETIDGATTKTITGPAQGRIVCDGTLFRTIGFSSLSDLQHGQCQLQHSSGSVITLVPKSGNKLKIAGVLYDVPAAGVASGNPASAANYINGVPSQTLAASTLYYVYAAIVTGTMILDFSTTTHARDTTGGNVGVEIKNGDNTRTLVGMVYTSAAPAFVANQVRSWFNDGGVVGRGTFNTNPATAAGPSELSSSIRVYLLTWTGEMVDVKFQGMVSAAAVNDTSYTNINVDGVNNAVGSQRATFQSAGGNYYNAVTSDDSRNTYTEGLHFWSINGQVSAGTSTWAGVVGAGDALLTVVATGNKGV